MVQSSTLYRITTDHLGTPRLITNVATGAVAERLDVDEWGKVLTDRSPGLQPFGFAAGLSDLDTGLVRFGARDYASVIGRWTTKDPVWFKKHRTNKYLYVEDDPVNRWDSTGYDGFGPWVSCVVSVASCIRSCKP